MPWALASCSHEEEVSENYPLSEGAGFCTSLHKGGVGKCQGLTGSHRKEFYRVHTCDALYTLDPWAKQ